MTNQHHSDGILRPWRTSDRPFGDESTTARSEDIHIRNYDHQWGYDLDVVVTSPDGEPVVSTRYYLPPGQSTSECDLLPSGEYELHVTLDNSREETLQCRISSAPDHTAVIEVGNGGLGLTEGLHS